MLQKEIFQGYLCPLCSTKQEWLRHKRAHSVVRHSEWGVQGQKRHTENEHLLRATKKLATKEVLRGKQSGMWREQACIQKSPVNKAGCWENPRESRRKNLFFRGWPQRSGYSIIHGPAKAAGSEECIAELSEQYLASWNSVSHNQATAVQW